MAGTARCAITARKAHGIPQSWTVGRPDSCHCPLYARRPDASGQRGVPAKDSARIWHARD